MTKIIESTKERSVRRNVYLIITAIAAAHTAISQENDPREWQHYGGSQHGMQYSALDQITKANVADLEEVWRYRTDELGEGHREPFAFEANPILVEGKLYLPMGGQVSR